MAVAALNGIPQNPVKFDPGKCPAWSTVSKHLFGTAAATYTTDEAMVYEVYSPLILPIASGDASMGSLATTSIMAGMLLPALARARGEARAMKCKNNLRQLATASIQYIDQYGKGRCYPKSLAEIYTSKLLTVPDLFRCPDGQAPTQLAEGVMTSYESAFDRAGAEYQFADRTPSNQIMIWEKEPCHKGRRNVAYFDAHVESMDEQGFQGALKKLDKHIADEKAAKAKPKE
jgi:prepilin-type processing-associated H-X9-DG protein